MDQEQSRSREAAAPEAGRWEAPSYRVQALDCEISAYAPDDRPLF